MVFLNTFEPPEWYGADRRELCDKILKWIPDYILQRDLVNEGNIKIFFLSGGVSSIVCRIETDSEKYVLKILTSHDVTEGEALFLREWSRIGIRTPRIVDEGISLGHAYLLMEHIEAKTLSQKFTPQELLEKKIFFTLGRTLAIMHTPTARGCGEIKGGTVQFNDARTWWQGSKIKEEIAYAMENKLIPETLIDSLSSDIEDFIGYIDTDRTVFCHNDFSVSHVFATEPLTVIDPNPIIHHPLFDVARSILTIANLSIDLSDGTRMFLEGYKEQSSCSLTYLKSALLLQACLKFSYWHRAGKSKSIEKARKFLDNYEKILSPL